MIVTAFLLITILLSLGAARLVYFGVSARAWPLLIAGVSLSVFVYLYGAWIFLSAYAKYLFIAVVLVTISIALTGRPKRTGRTATAFYILLSLLFFALDVLYFTGMEGSVEYADLAFPLKGKSYFVFQGGKGLPSNIFHYNTHHEVYAMDIVKLDAYGRRCSKVFSGNLSDYFIFGDTIYSPCSGIVLRTTSQNPDNIPPNRVAGQGKLNGVLIDGGSYFVYLGHLQQDQVFVEAGQKIIAGQPVGLAGNSGMSLEPHLHIQVHKKMSASLPWYSQPQLYCRFNGRAYLLFQIIKS